jgi:hypothetical protein
LKFLFRDGEVENVLTFDMNSSLFVKGPYFEKKFLLFESLIIDAALGALCCT